MGQWNAVDVLKQTIEALMAGAYDQCPFAEDCEITDLGSGLHVTGWGRLREAVAAFSEIEACFVNTVSDGRKCAIEGEYEMVHSGDLEWPHRTLRASGKPVKLRACYVATFDKQGDGALITRLTTYWNPMDLLEQIGLT